MQNRFVIIAKRYITVMLAFINRLAAGKPIRAIWAGIKHIVTGTRRIAALLAGISSLVSLFLLAVSLYKWSFVFVLIFWFIAMFSIFHFVFFSRTSITQLQVKLIDYPYLLVGALGIFLAVAEGDKDREKYISGFDEITAPSSPAGLRSLIRGVRDQFCPNQADYIPQNFCIWSSQIAQFLSSTYTSEQLEQQISESQDSTAKALLGDEQRMVIYYVLSPKNLMHLITVLRPQVLITRWFSEPVTVQNTLNLAYPLIIRSMQKIHEKSLEKPTQSEGGEEVFDVSAFERMAIGLGKVVVWPFVLAIALALRLTKVTADVLGWAQP